MKFIIDGDKKLVIMVKEGVQITKRSTPDLCYAEEWEVDLAGVIEIKQENKS